MSENVEVTLTRGQYDMLLSGLRTIANIPIRDLTGWSDDHIVYRIDGGALTVRVGHIREAREILRTLSVTSGAKS